MIGTFGLIPEEISPGSEGISHEQRFGARNDGSAGLMGLHWRKGRDLLLVDENYQISNIKPTLPPRPKRVTDERLWIPINDDYARLVGPIYHVGTRAIGPLIRVRSESLVLFVPEVTVVVGQRRSRVLGSLDGMDPSRRRRLEKTIQISRGRALPLHTLFPESTAQLAKGTPSDPQAGLKSHALPPAAISILAAIEREELGHSHVHSYQRRDSAPILFLLENRGLVRVLPSGQIVTTSRYHMLCAQLVESGVEIDSKHAARAWHTSGGMAGVLLDQLVNDRLMDKVSSHYYQVRRDAQE